MRITRKEQSQLEVRAMDIPWGQVFSGWVNGTFYSTLLRTWRGIVALPGAGMAWGHNADSSATLLIVSNYIPLDAELVIHGPLKKEILHEV